MWAADAKAEIRRAHGEGRLPILVGGTGLYLRTLIDGIAPIPEIDPGIRQAVRELATHDAYDALLREDPAIAARLKPADRTKSEEHTSELQSLMRISYAVFCLKKKNKHTIHKNTTRQANTDTTL